MSNNSIFSYDSPPMQMLMRLGDLILLNLVYVVCCIPVFTIGAAQAGMYTACRVMQNKEDDSSILGAYWRGFRTGFVTVTIAWNVLSVVLALIIWLSIASIGLQGSPWLSILAITVCASFPSLVPAFHSRFTCTPWQLIRNTWFMLFAHPLRTLLITAMLWLPPAVLLLDLYAFMACTPIWLTLYYGTIFSAATSLVKKPFNVLVDHFNETHGLNQQTPTEETPEE